MTIVRSRLTFEDHFTQLPNAWMRDGRLSLKARGLLAQLMTHRAGWSVSIASLVAANPEGRDAIRGAVLELEKHGYLTREQSHADQGKFGENIYRLTTPSSAPSSGYPTTAEPTSGEPSSENPLHKNTIPEEDHLEEDQETSSGIDEPGAREDVETVCSAMAEHVHQITGKPKRISKTWRRDARLMLDSDGHTVDAILAAIRWVHGSGFWAGNVLSVGKLREKWWTLESQARQGGTRTRSRDVESMEAIAGAAARRAGRMEGVA